jgi:PAS domain S-box-containing protein
MGSMATSQHSDPLELSNVIETIPALVVCVLSDGSAEFVNRAWQEYTGYSPQQQSGSFWQTSIHPGDRAKFMDEWNVAISAGKPFEAEARVLRADGQYRWFLVKRALAVLRTRNSKPALHTLIAFEDINERKLAQAELQQSEARYRVLVETAGDAVVSVDESSRIQFANPSTMRIFGYDPTELIGKPLTVLMPEFMRKAHENGFRRYLSTGRRQANWQGMEVTGRRKNGEEFPIEVSLGELIRDGNHVFTGIIRDISEKKRAEEERKRLRQELARLAHLNRVGTLGELTASLAHEIKQPIGAAVTNAEACLRFLDRDQPDVPEAREAALEMTRDARRAADIIERVRSLYRKGSSHDELVDINEVIREMVDMLRDEASRYRVTMRTGLAERLPKVMADRVQLQQVLMNLMLNGIEAMRDTTGELSIKSQLTEEGQVLISVTDTGVGLPTGRVDEIFNAFFTTKPQGTGMGLAITRSIVESHGGRLWPTANSGRGTTLQFTLPQQRAAHA